MATDSHGGVSSGDSEELHFDREGDLQEIDVRLPRKVSYSIDTGSVTMENARKESASLGTVDLYLAATLVKDALASRNMDFKTDEKSLRAYWLYQHPVLKWLLYVAIWGNLGLAIFEKPAVVYLPYWSTMLMELVFLGYFLFRFLHNLYFDLPSKFWRDPKNITVLVIIVLTVIDMFCYIMWRELASPNMAAKAVRWSRPFRPLYLINFPEGRQIRKAFRNIRRTLPDIFYVLVLFLSSIALFSLMAMKLHQKRGMFYPDGRPYLNDFFESYWDLYVLVTTANNPDVMMPAYDQSNWYALFFIVYLMLNLYIFMSIVLAVVYNNYKRHLKNEVRASVYLKRRVLGRAFDIIKVCLEGRYVVPKDRWQQLMSVVDPKRSPTQVELLLHVLDNNGDNNIERSEFLKVADLLHVNLIEKQTNKMTFLEQYATSCFMSRPSEFIKAVVMHKGFRYFFDFAIIVNAVCIGLSLDQAEWFFLSIFLLEILLKMYTYGPVKFFKSLWNIFDFLIILTAVIATLVETALEDDEGRDRSLDFILVLRVLRLIRLVNSFEKFRIILQTIVNIGPSIVTYGGVIFVIYYFYAIIGMEVFQDRIRYFGYKDLNETTRYCGNAVLNNSEFYTKQYCSNNFNSITNAFVVLFELMVVNQWHVLTDGFVRVTHKAARLYFISFHLFCVIILLNILTAFILEVFLLEYSLSRGKLEDTLERKIKDMGLGVGQTPVKHFSKKKDKEGLVDTMETQDEPNGHTQTGAAIATVADQSNSSNVGETTANHSQLPVDVGQDSGLRFKLKNRATKQVEVLLQALFEGEIDPTDEGPEGDMTTMEPEERTRRLTLDNIS